MTKVYLEQDGRQYTLDAQGHATGNPVACASVSTLVTALSNWIHASGSTIVQERLADGNARLVFCGDAAAEAVFGLICVGFLQLQAAAPDAVCVDVMIL